MLALIIQASIKNGLPLVHAPKLCGMIRELSKLTFGAFLVNNGLLALGSLGMRAREAEQNLGALDGNDEGGALDFA